jgi:hypothetical protein
MRSFPADSGVSRDRDDLQISKDEIETLFVCNQTLIPKTNKQCIRFGPKTNKQCIPKTNHLGIKTLILD